MKLTDQKWLRTGQWVVLCLAALTLGRMTLAQTVNTTTVQGTVYQANGRPGSGMLDVSWPAFTTASNQAVAAGRITGTIAPDGFVSVSLAPNQGATPAGLFYTVIYHLSDGTTSTEYWVVPSAAQASLSQVRSQVMPAAQAVQAVSKTYVDQLITNLSNSVLSTSGGTVSGPLYLSGDPTQPLQAADKHYVDAATALSLPLAGGNMTGALTTPAVNGVEIPATGSTQTTLQAAMTAAGSAGAMEIPPTYTGSDTFTNPNGLYVADLRTLQAQQYERSVKEFGAVCDGSTDDTGALQSALNYAFAHGVALTLPQGTCKTRTLTWHGESIGGMGKQVSALMGYPGQDVLATMTDSTSLLSNTRLHDLTIYVDQSLDVSCMPAEGRASAGNCAVNRPMESASIFSPGGNGITGTVGSGAGWSIGNCAIAMPAATGTGGNGLKVAEIENVAITTTGTDPMAQYSGAHSTHTCGLYLGQWPQWSEFRNIDIRGLNTGIAIPALSGTTPTGLTADSNRWQNITIQATHGFTAATGSNNVLDNVVVQAGNSAATGEPPTGLILDVGGSQQGWTVRNAVVTPLWNAVLPKLTVSATGGAVTAVAVGSEHGLGLDPYGTQVSMVFSGSCTAQATATVNSYGAVTGVTVTQGGVGCSSTTTASMNVAGTWDTAAPVNLIAGRNMTFVGGNLLSGNGGYTVWNAARSQSNGTQVNGGGGGTLPGGGTYGALVASSSTGAASAVDQFPGSDFGAQLQACLNTVNASYGGTCDARNFSGTVAMGSDLTISTPNATVLLPCATISTVNHLIVSAGTRNVSLRGCSMQGASAASGSQGGTVFLFSGTGAAVQVGDPTYAVNTVGFHMDNAVINTTTASSSTARALTAYRTQEMNLEELYLLGNSNQTGIVLDGTGNYTGGTFIDNHISGFQTAVSAIGHQATNSATTDWVNASAFVRLHVDCPTSGGSPISGTYGINLQQGDGNTFTGGDIENCNTALHLGGNAQNNTLVGVRNENSNNQVIADAGSSYNNWMSGGTMFTGQLTDNGIRNSFLDTFHRSFNGMNGDWYGSQKDATVTNHYRIGIGSGNERGLLNRYQTDYGYRWTTGFSDATAGEQYYQILDELNNVNRLSIGQYNNGQSSTNNQTVVNAAGTGAVVLNGSAGAGTGGVVISSGGTNPTTVGTVSSTGNAQFNGTLQVGGTSTFTGSTTIRNQADAEIDAFLWAGATANQKESFIYKDWSGNSQWYMVKDANNNWALNSAIGGLDSFKAYQSTNSGDTYVNASNSTGVVRVNYESGSGTAFSIYGGSSSALYASFAGTSAIKFPGLASSTGRNCLQIDASGYITNTGATCGTGNTNGTVGVGTIGQIAYYTGNGTAVSGTSTVSVTAGGTGASTATAALTNLGGASVTSTATQTFTGAITAPAVTASLNKTLVVTAPPYNAKCDGATDDHNAIQAAFNDALANGYRIQFPSGVCKTSTVTWYGQPFFGAGVSQTAILGMPGQDVFATPDAAVTLLFEGQIQDLTIDVDSSVNAAATAVGGNNTFPNRISGTAGGLTPLANPPAPGPIVFGPNLPGNCAGSISAGSSTFTLPCSAFTSTPSQFIVGTPITISGAGTGGSDLVTTVAAVLSGTQLTTAMPASVTVTSASGSWGSPITAPWYFGNCGIAIPATSGTAMSSGLNGWIFRNIQIQLVNSTAGNRGNYTCGIFIQSSPYALRFENVEVMNLFGGIIEAPPAINQTAGYFAWTPDTNSYKDIDLKFDMLPMVWYNGTHRFAHGISIYGGNAPFALGLFQFSATLGTNSSAAPTATIEQYYDECWSPLSGELARFSGSNNINGGSLAQCVGPSYIGWSASQSDVDAQIGDRLVIYGSQNSFHHTQLAWRAVTDFGNENSVQSGVPSADTAQYRSFWAGSTPQEPVGKLDGNFLLTGNSATPYVSGSDLFTTCRDYRQLSGANSTSTCINDPTGIEISKSYIHVTGAGVTAGFGTGDSPDWSPLMTLGTRIPMTKVWVVTQGECEGAAACSASLYLRDLTKSTTIATCTLNFGSTWTMQGTPMANLCTLDLSGATQGDVLGWSTSTWSGAPSGVNLAFLGFEPPNAATYLAVASVLPNGTTAVTQNPGDSSSAVATDGFVAAAVTASGGAPIASPAFTGYPTAPTQTAGDSSTALATDAFVATAVSGMASLASPALTGAPTAPTQTAGDNSNKLATDAFVATAVGGLAPLVSPVLTGTPTAPTQPAGDSSTKLATDAFVGTAVGGLAPLVSPALTGAPTAPTQTAGDSSTKLATDAFVGTAVGGLAPLVSPVLTGAPTAPTQTVGDSSTKLATDAFVATAVSGLAPLASPALTGAPTAPTQTVGDSSTALATDAFVANSLGSYAPLASPSLTGNPTAPTAAIGTNSTQVATTAFVQSAMTTGNFMTVVPPWLQFLGDGSQGAFSCTSGTCNVGGNGEMWYSSFSVSAGAIVTNTGSNNAGPLVIRSTGVCTIAGTVSMSKNSGTGGGLAPSGVAANWSAQGGGGGGGTAAGGGGGGNSFSTGSGSAGSAGGGAGGSGLNQVDGFHQRILVAGTPTTETGNSQYGVFYQGGGGGGNGGSSGGGGGYGGGAIVMVCGSINFTGTIDVSGQAGAGSSANNTGAGGGGGGGYVILRSPNWPANTGTVNVSGGAGGSCGSYTGCGAGGSGAAGWYKKILN